MDVDWSPDYILESTIEWFVENNIATTVFMTHKSEVAYKYKDHPLVEIGIHPFFKNLKDSKNIVSILKNLYPFSIGSRSHRNITGRDYVDALKYHGYIYDVSKLLFGAFNTEITPMYNGMIEAPYIWEDGVHLEMGLPISEKAILQYILKINKNNGLNILNIHPIVFYINPVCLDDIDDIYRQYDDLTSAPMHVLERKIVSGFGMSSFIKRKLLGLQQDGFNFYSLRDIMTKAYELNKERKEGLYGA